jgi:hypothetical protein
MRKLFAVLLLILLCNVPLAFGQPDECDCECPYITTYGTGFLCDVDGEPFSSLCFNPDISNHDCYDLLFSFATCNNSPIQELAIELVGPVDDCLNDHVNVTDQSHVPPVTLAPWDMTQGPLTLNFDPPLICPPAHTINLRICNLFEYCTHKPRVKIKFKFKSITGKICEIQSVLNGYKSDVPQEDSDGPSMVISPNPGNDRIRIRTSVDISTATLVLLTTDGKEMLRQTLPGSSTGRYETSIDAQLLPSGVYTVVVEGKGYKLMENLVIGR